MGEHQLEHQYHDDSQAVPCEKSEHLTHCFMKDDGEHIGLSTIPCIDGLPMPICIWRLPLYCQGFEQIWAVYGYSVVSAVFYCILWPYTAINTVTTLVEVCW